MSDHGKPAVPGSASHGDIDVPSGTATTGHEWDGIKELNTPLPRWWLWVFYVTQVWALGYIILYPAVPLLKDATTGLLGWHSRGQVEQEIDAAELARADVLARIRELPLEEIVSNDELRNAAFRGGQSAFKVNCVQCHGADAAGSRGFANLNDDDWLWGGTLQDIYTTVQHGIRFAGDPDTRVSEMPAFGRDGILEPGQIDQVAQYVVALADGGKAAPEGAQLFADNCASCHGERGEGNRELGAPRLSDAVWLYDSSFAGIRAQIANPAHGSMPAWGSRLSDTVVKELTIYVHGLGGGEAVQALAGAPAQ